MSACVETWQESLAEVKETISCATEDADEIVKKPLRQTLRNSGKLLRPSMVLWAASLDGRRADRSVIKAAAAVELLHTSSLIHDDIIDDGEVRRGLPSVHSLFGNSVAVYTGDYTIVKCYKLLHESGNDGLIYDFILASEKLCKSEIIQYQNRGKELSEKSCRRIAAGKTGALFALSLKIGGILAGLNEDLCNELACLGENFGIAFQFADDCLDYKEKGSINKNVLSDLRHGLYTMPLVLALKKDDGTLRELLSQDLTDDRAEKICALVHELGGISAAKAQVRESIKSCRKYLSHFSQMQGGEFMANLLDYTEEQNR